MDINLLFTALSGLGLFLFALRFLSQALDESLTLRLAPWLKKVDKGIIVPFSSGLLMTVFVQASSISVLTTMGLISKNLIGLETAIYMMLGATIGTTIKSWFFAADIKLIGPLLIVISSGLLLFVRQHFKRRFLEVALSIGLMFLGWEMLNVISKTLFSYPIIRAWAMQMQAENIFHLSVAALMGFALTCLVQSSSTVVLLILALANQEHLPFTVCAGMILGANIGTTTTGLIASLEYHANVKRLALGHFLVKFIGASMALILFPAFIRSVDYIFLGTLQDMDMPSRLAAVHTGFNLINASIWIVICPILLRMTRWFIPSHKLNSKIWLTRPVKNLLIQVPEQALIEIEREWEDLKNKVKAFEDIVFSRLEDGPKPRLVIDEYEIKNEIDICEEMLLGVLMRNDAQTADYATRATQYLTQFGQLKLTYQAIKLIKENLDSYSQKKIDLLKQGLQKNLISVSKRRHKLWLAIMVGSDIDSVKLNRKLIRKLQQQLTETCRQVKHVSKPDLYAIYNLSTLILGHLQRLVTLAAQGHDHTRPQSTLAPVTAMPKLEVISITRALPTAPETQSQDLST